MRRIAVTGTLLVLLSASIGLPTQAAEPASTGGSFRAAGSLETGRLEHTATLLPEGGVLIVGGTSDDGILATAELWDPVSESFGPAGTLIEARSAHTATLLSDGGVLIVGGYNDEGSLASAELWDPVGRSFTAAGSLAEARNSHTATLLPDGGVLIAGGLTNDLVNLPTSAELWDPVSGSFGPAGSLAEGRSGHTATLTPDGVLVVGGVDLEGKKRGSAELWVPASMTFVPAGSLIERRAGHTATLLPDSVLIVGGVGADSTLASAEKWDPGSGTFVAAGSLAETRSLHTATRLPDGGVLIVGGVDLIDIRASSELWDRASGSFGSMASLSAPRAWHTATLLPDGGVLIVGGTGEDGSPTGSAELWEPGAQGSPSPSAPDKLDAALAIVELLNMPPAGIMETCQPTSPTPGSPTLDGQLAVIQCSFGSDTVIYASFDDVASLHAAYDQVATAAGAEDGTSCQEGPFEGSYLAADGSEAGHVVCQINADGVGLAWTDDRSLILGFLTLMSDGGYAALHDHWLQVRLDAASAAGPSSSSPGVTQVPAGPGGEIRQWAASATASSQYLKDDWSAQQATGSPDTPEYGDQPTAWAPGHSDGGLEWLELTYPRSVVPTAVNVWESSGAGALTMIEALPDGSDSWVTLWTGTDPSPDALTTFSPPLTAIPTSVRRLRLTLDTSVLGWNEIDAVELVGTVPP